MEGNYKLDECPRCYDSRLATRRPRFESCLCQRQLETKRKRWTETAKFTAVAQVPLRHQQVRVLGGWPSGITDRPKSEGRWIDSPYYKSSHLIEVHILCARRRTQPPTLKKKATQLIILRHRFERNSDCQLIRRLRPDEQWEL